MAVCRFLNTCVLVFVWNLNMPIWLCNIECFFLLSNIYFSFQCLVIIHMRAQFKDNCVGTCAYVGCMCNVDIFIIFRKPLKRVWCTCSVCGLLHFSYMYVCMYRWREWTGCQSTVCGVTIKSRATNPHQVVFPCLEIGKVV